MSRSFWDFLFFYLWRSLVEVPCRGVSIYCVGYSEGPFRLETQVLQVWDMFFNSLISFLVPFPFSLPRVAFVCLLGSGTVSPITSISCFLSVLLFEVVQYVRLTFKTF